MTLDLGAPERGCLLLADITGYTGYMAGTELTHAQDVVADLLETIVGHVEPVFQLSKLEGDAAFAYAAENETNPSMMLDTVESAYFAFQRRLRDIVHSTTCECNACIRIPDLDLKFFVHAGEYMVRRIARSEELTGPDVILVHRLAKGTAGKTIGKPAYAVYTKVTLESMAMDPTILGFVPHTEELADLGAVEVFVQDLALRWTFEKERNRDYITSSQSVLERSFVTSAPPPVIWDHLTDPSKRPVWQHLTDAVHPQYEGPVTVGAVNHCMHGPDRLIERVADWRPFSYITARYDFGDIVGWAWTTELEPVDEGTQVTIRVADPGEATWSVVRDLMVDNVDRSVANLESMLADHMAAETNT